MGTNDNQHTVAAILSFALYSFLEPFIAHWLGADYIMDHRILILLILYIYITNSRQAVDGFNYAHGLYADVWSAWAELIINVTVTIVCGLKWGIIGILIGKLASLLPIVVIWKPYYLFTSGFKKSVAIYWKGVLRNYTISLTTFALATYILKNFPINPYSSIGNWMAYSAIGMIIFLFINITATLLFAKGAIDSLNRIKSVIKK